MNFDHSIPNTSLMKKIAALLTCHNRCEKTIACLDALFLCSLPEGYSLDVLLVDDGSTDGTSEATRKRFPLVKVIKGDGNLYWNGGMRIAFDAAMKRSFDYYLWLNDDTMLYPQSLLTLIKTATERQVIDGKSVIVVGSTQDGRDGQQTYGGVNRAGQLKPTAFVKVAPQNIAVRCETMNGNCVLIPNQIARAVGGMEHKFAHAMGDLDYGLRAGYAGYQIWVMPSYAGTCSNNSSEGSFNDASLSVSERLRKMKQPKGLPLTSWRVFTQRHAGVLWPLYWLWPYAKVLLNGVVKKF